MLVNQGVLLGRRYLKKNVIKKFTKRINIPNTVLIEQLVGILLLRMVKVQQEIIFLKIATVILDLLEHLYG